MPCSRRAIDFNRSALAWARANRKPVVGNTDLHLLEQMGTTYSLIDAERDPDAICEAIRDGRVEVRREALSIPRAARIFAKMVWGGIVGRYGPRGRNHASCASAPRQVVCRLRARCVLSSPLVEQPHV